MLPSVSANLVIFSFVRDQHKSLSALVKKGGDISVVVEELGPALTHKDTDIRLKGTKFLSDLLKSISNDFLSQAQIEFIVQFYCDRYLF